MRIDTVLACDDRNDGPLFERFEDDSDAIRIRQNGRYAGSELHSTPGRPTCKVLVSVFKRRPLVHSVHSSQAATKSYTTGHAARRDHRGASPAKRPVSASEYFRDPVECLLLADCGAFEGPLFAPVGWLREGGTGGSLPGSTIAPRNRQFWTFRIAEVTDVFYF